MNNPSYEIPNDHDVSPTDIHPGADLSESNLVNADLSGANLKNADLSGANLGFADLSEANLDNADLLEADVYAADLSGVSLYGAEIRGANLSYTDLSEATLDNSNLPVVSLFRANLSGASLAGAYLPDADLSNADLSETSLINANLAETVLDDTVLKDAAISQGTVIDPPGEQLQLSSALPQERRYDKIARANHELRESYSKNGLISKARRARVRERKARRREARAEGGLGWIVYLWSCGSQLLTGYGIQLRWITAVMTALWLLSAVAYWNGGMPPGQSLYYSIVTFTTSPPSPPPEGIPKLVAGVETFAGTTATVFLGYVLGTRERV